MKLSILSLFLILFTANNCSEEIQSEVSQIEYEMFTRGSSTKYTAMPGELEIKGTGLQKTQKTVKLTSEDWKDLLKSLQEVDMEKLNQLESPSEERARDAAPHAIVSIRKNDTLYKTNSFDHGNAPLPLKPLTEAILRLAENVE